MLFTTCFIICVILINYFRLNQQSSDFVVISDEIIFSKDKSCSTFCIHLISALLFYFLSMSNDDISSKNSLISPVNLQSACDTFLQLVIIMDSSCWKDHIYQEMIGELLFEIGHDISPFSGGFTGVLYPSDRAFAIAIKKYSLKYIMFVYDLSLRFYQANIF